MLVFSACSPALAAEAGPWIGLMLEQGEKGARVVRAIDGAPGQKAGIVAGDQVLMLDATPTPSAGVLIESVRRSGVGQVVTLKILGAKGALRAVAVTLAARPELSELQRTQLIGRTAPDFQPVVKSGAKLPKISALKGQVVLLDFFATWCGPCVAQMPHLNELHEQLGAKGLKVIGISTESGAVVQRAAEAFKLKYTVASDENDTLSRSYQVYALPTLVVIDRQGVVREVAVANTAAVDAAVAAALQGN